jgi:hypothetical protein
MMSGGVVCRKSFVHHKDVVYWKGVVCRRS